MTLLPPVLIRNCYFSERISLLPVIVCGKNNNNVTTLVKDFIYYLHLQKKLLQYVRTAVLSSKNQKDYVKAQKDFPSLLQTSELQVKKVETSTLIQSMPYVADKNDKKIPGAGLPFAKKSFVDLC